MLTVMRSFAALQVMGKRNCSASGIKDLTYEEDYIFDIKLHQRLIAGEIPFYKLEKRYVRKDGEIIWAEVSRSLMRDADGKPLYTVGAVLDVSERRQAEQEIAFEHRASGKAARRNEYAVGDPAHRCLDWQP